MSNTSEARYVAKVNEMMSYRGFIPLFENVYTNESRHRVIVLYINDGANIKDDLIEVRRQADAPEFGLTHIIVVYTGALNTNSRKRLIEFAQPMIFTDEDKHYEILTTDDIQIAPVDTYFSSDELIIYPARTYMNNLVLAGLTRHVEIEDGKPMMANLTLEDPLVKYLNLVPGSIVVSKHDRGFDTRVCSMTYKTYIVIDHISCSLDALGLDGRRREFCNCTYYNSLFVLDHQSSNE